MSVAFPVHSSDDLTPSEVAAYYSVRAPKLRQHGQQWRGHCPIHDGQDDNFAVEAATGFWFCHSQCGRGGSVYDLEMTLSSTDFRAAANEVRRIVGRPALGEVERRPELKWGLPGWSHDYLREKIEKVELEKQWKHTALYPYFYPDGRFCYVKVRFTDKQNHKTFRQWAVTPKLGWATRKRAGVEPLLYRWNTLAQADEILIVNGEKAADRGHEVLGLCTTCLPDGEGKWQAAFTETFRDKIVRVVIDNDAKGEKHGKIIGQALFGVAREVKLIRLPDLPPKGDLWDWIEAGGTCEGLREFVDKAPLFEAASIPLCEDSEPEKPPAERKRPARPRTINTPSLLTQLYNDTGNADRLIAMSGQELRYCPPFRKWLVWDGRRWAVDETGGAPRPAKTSIF